MAKLPSIKNLMVEDIGKDAPEWFRNFLTPLNSFMSSVYFALDRDITFTENINSSIKEISFTTEADYTVAVPPLGWIVQSIANPLKKKPVGAVLIGITNLTDYSIITLANQINWYYSEGSIKINYVTGLKNSTKYKITLLIF